MAIQCFYCVLSDFVIFTLIAFPKFVSCLIKGEIMAYTRRQFIKRFGSGLAALSLTPWACNRVNNDRPNLVMIMADDIGFSDIGCYGAEISTPNLDRLAANGIRFGHFYNMAKCNPTRSSLFTGHYFGDDRSINFAQLFKDAGYYTLFSGKEHFDDWVPESCYAANIFDQSFTFWATTEYFIPPSGKFSRPFYLNGKELDADHLPGTQKPFYKTDAFTDQALEWLEGPLREKQSFLLCLPYHVAHYPLQARPEDIAKYRGKYKKGWDVIRQERFERMQSLGIINENARLSPPESNTNKFRGHPGGYDKERRKFPLYRPWNTLTDQEKDDYDLEMAVFAAMIDRLDRNIGRVLQRLDSAGVMDNTLIVFFTDNGSCPFDSNRDFDIPPGPADSYRCLRPAWANVGNTPFRLYKQNGHEGGCNTHFIAHWPRVINPGQITMQPGHVVDIFPTFLQAAGIAYPDHYRGEPTRPLHGYSLMPVFRGRQRPEPPYFISGNTEKFRMFRMGEWKIVRQNNGPWELYNLADDPTEIDDLALTLPEKVDELIQSYHAVMESMPGDVDSSG